MMIAPFGITSHRLTRSLRPFLHFAAAAASHPHLTRVRSHTRLQLKHKIIIFSANSIVVMFMLAPLEQ